MPSKLSFSFEIIVQQLACDNSEWNERPLVSSFQDFTSKLATLIENTDCRKQMGSAAAKITRNEHSFEIAAKKVNLLVKNSLNSYRAKI